MKSNHTRIHGRTGLLTVRAASLALAAAGMLAAGLLAVGLAGCDGGGDDGGNTADTSDGGGDTSGESDAASDTGGTGDDTADGAGDDTTGESDGSDFDTVQVELPDTGDFTPSDTASAFVDGNYVDFDSYCTASFVPDPEAPGGPGTIQIVMAAGIVQVELQIAPVVPEWEGSSDTTSGAPAALVLYNDGTIDPAVAQFKYAAGGDAGGEWEFIIEENADNRVKGTFSAQLVLQAGEGPDPMFITDGEFDCGF